MVDVHAAHRAGIRPLPARVRTGDVITVVIDPGPGTAPVIERRDAATNRILPQTVPARIESWKSALLDLSMRNPLLNFRPSRGGLELLPPRGKLPQIEDHLHSGEGFMVHPADQVGELARARGVREATAEADELLQEAWDALGAVLSTTRTKEFATRLRSLISKARLQEQETGANNLYLTLGSLTWEDPRSSAGPVQSPIFLVPVRLDRARGSDIPVVRLDEGGISTPNYCLIEALRARHNLTVPFFSEDMADDSGLDIERGMSSLRKAITDRGLPFLVNDSSALAVLQFSKFRLWKDLDDHWAELMASPVVKHFVENPKTPYVDPANPAKDAVVLDETEVFTPVPADGAQLRAITRAVNGESFVLEGPPGTGKSQTITNLLANALAKGRTVLFVAEKQAALSVVKERLHSVGLDPYCLDLHDKGSDPASIRRQLLHALDHHPGHDAAAWERTERDFAAGASMLRTYRDRLHSPNTNGVSYWAAHVRLGELGPGQQAPVPRRFLEVDAATVTAIREVLASLPAVSGPAQPRPAHPWHLADATSFEQIDRPALTTAINNVRAALDALPTVPLSLPIAGEATTLDELLATQQLLWLHTVGALPPTTMWERVSAAGWRDRANALVEQARAAVASHGEVVGQVGVDLLDVDFGPTLAALEAAKSSFALGRKGRIRGALGDLATRPPFTGMEPPAAAELVARFAAAATALRSWTDAIRSVDGLELPADWRVEAPGALDTAATYIDVLDGAARLLSGTGDCAVAARRFVDAPPMLPPGILTHLGAFDSALRDVQQRLGATEHSIDRWRNGEGLLDAARRSVDDWAADAEENRFIRLQRWLVLSKELEPLTDAGLNEFVEVLLTGSVNGIDAADVFERGFMATTLLDCAERSNLDVFDRYEHDRSIGRFTALLEERQERLRTVIPSLLADGRRFNAQAGVGEVASLRNELQRKSSRGGRSVRQLLSHYPELIQQLSPCFLMSPDSVAKFLTPGKITFDIAVFDEASQIRVAEAVGAMGRARSVVVVGDSRQMPPTTFGAAGSAEPDDLYGTTDIDPLVPEEADSILEEAIDSGLDQEWLSWHYRSQDEALIKFSNDRYYESKLASFPTPAPNRGGRGLDYRRVAGQFDHGGKRNNPVEAKAIVEEIRRRAHDPVESTWSIGVVTLNREQQLEIETQLDALGDPRVNQLRETGEDEERLFVLNLENVQGRERDVILFSTAFSRRADGTAMPLNFGPLNRVGGERRLNVAVTRARRQVVVFSSFDPEDIDENRTTSVGLRHLREYLQLARDFSGQGHAATDVDTEPTDRHRREITEALRERGLRVTADLGLSSFKVDLALSLPEVGDKWLVGVLLDGPDWADRPTVIDRDALPVSVLGGMLGWPRIARVWLPSWRSEPDQVIADLVEATRTAMHTPEPDHAALAPETTNATTTGFSAEEPGVPSEPVVVTAPPPDRTESVQSAAAPVPGAPDDPGAYDDEELFEPWPLEPILGSPEDLDLQTPAVRAAAMDAISFEGPIEVERLLKSVANRFGLARVRASRLAALRSAIPPELIETSSFGEWAWPSADRGRGWKAFRTSDSLIRPIDEIAPAEILNAASAVLAHAFSAEREELVRELAGLFGAKRVTAKIAERVGSIIDWGLAEGRLAEDDGRLRPGPS
nr:DUF4011 domain-containing protein [Rhabdothermincola salaria]